jgi:membrane protease YdiL (CAAX protease family)
VIEREEQAFWNWQDFLIFAALALPSIFLGMLICQGVMSLIPGYSPSKAMKALPGQFLGYLLWFIALRWLLLMKYDRPFWSSLGWRWPREGILRYVTFGMLLTVFVIMLAAVLRTPQIKSPMDELMDSNLSITMVGISAVALAPVCEELAFRGFLQPLLQLSVGAWPAVLLTALPFALMHGSQYAWNWQRLLLLTVAGSAFGWVRVRSGSTLAATAAHATYNFSYFLTFILIGKDSTQTW